MEAHTVELHLAQRRLGQGERLSGRRDAGLGVEDLADALHGAGALLHLAPGFAQDADGAGRQDGQHQELEEGPAGHAVRAAGPGVGEHGVGAGPQHHRHAAEHHDDHRAGHDRPGAHAGAGGAEGGLHQLAEPRGDRGFAPEGLHRVQGVQGLAGIGHRLGETVLGLHRQAAHPPAQDEHRGQHQGDQHQHEQAEARADVEHHRHRAQEGEEVAQRQRGGGADQVLDDGHVGGHPRQHLRGAGLQEEGLVQAGDVAKDRLAQVRDHPLAQLCDEIEAQGAGQGQDHDVRARQDEGLVQGRRGAAAGEAVVDHQPPGDGEEQGGAAGDQQRYEGGRGVAPMGGDEGAQATQGLQVLAPLAAARGGQHLLAQLDPWARAVGDAHAVRFRRAGAQPARLALPEALRV